MNIERNNETENEVEYVDNSTNKVSKRSKKRKAIIFLACLLFSFVVWCYANYLDDPIIKKEIFIDVHAQGFGSDTILTVYDDRGEEIEKIEVYGEKSNVYSVGTYQIDVRSSDFKEGSDTYTHEIVLHDGVYSHVKVIKIVKVVKTEK